MLTEQNKWVDRFSRMATLVATYSKDPSTKVGAVIVDQKNRVVSVGFNGFPRGLKDTDLEMREKKYLRTIHAEMNAILFAKCDLEWHSIYVTHPPCAQCAAAIIQVGIKNVVFPCPSRGFLDRWELNYNEAMSMFLEANVAVVQI